MTEKEKARVVALEGVCKHQVGLPHQQCAPLLLDHQHNHQITTTTRNIRTTTTTTTSNITCTTTTQISWAPLLWAQHQLRMAREQNLVSSDVLYHALNRCQPTPPLPPSRDIIGLKNKNGGLFDYTWVNIPLIYTQLVELSVFAYFYGCTIFGKQV